MKRSSWTSIARITAVYAVFGVVWIAASDRILEMLVTEPHRITVLQTYKGWGFVAASACLLLLLISREFRKREQTELQVEREKERARTYLDVAGVILLVLDLDGRVRLVNRKGAEILGLAADEIIGRNWFKSFVPEEKRIPALALFRSLTAGRSAEGDYAETPVVSAGGQEHPIAWHHVPLRDEAGSVTGVLSSGEDISIRRRAEEQAVCRLDQLAALHAIDLMITSTQDLRIILRQILDLVVAQFHVDAADILLAARQGAMLEYAAETGFRSPGIRRSGLRFGQGLAGLAALERKIIAVADLRDPSVEFLRRELLAGEDIVAYYAVPLTAKGAVKGVLELMHRSPLALDREQQDFLESLASQAAIAIDNAALFEDLQRSNVEMLLAYDATLEGWARALDLRDRETERHNERVTELTISLARAMGVRDEDLTHIRRGALLHDIGKIGIPDSILRKPGPLTAEERRIMEQHPVFAFEMLRPIAYLRRALDIPYCHHERWDGTGYPRGLKGEQIPLAARIFSLVDIWDAVFAADRPYRRPLSRSEACEHIKSLSGSHLDPAVVDAFLRLEGRACPALSVGSSVRPQGE